MCCSPNNGRFSSDSTESNHPRGGVCVCVAVLQHFFSSLPLCLLVRVIALYVTSTVVTHATTTRVLALGPGAVTRARGGRARLDPSNQALNACGAPFGVRVCVCVCVCGVCGTFLV